MSEFGERVVVGMAVGVIVAAATMMVRATPARLMRTNVSGRSIPAILGVPVALGALVVAAAHWIFGSGAEARAGAAVAVIVVISFSAGLFDDLRGEESERGFGGHLRAAAGGRVTGGVVKILGGGLAGLGAGFIAADGWAVLEVALAVALVANFVNLLDRAPGRAAKMWLVVALPLTLWGAELWAVAAAGMLGAVLVCLPVDLGERAMLGDAGSNPMGGVLGLGLAASLDRPGRIAVIVVALMLNIASEKWSFSRAIEAVPGLRWFDSLGRRQASRPAD
jgi:UDP-GlcNAc:undecaprenyl-phosphate/decaprenyl-phosphate GlcNAc-1-phosphate transferase